MASSSDVLAELKEIRMNQQRHTEAVHGLTATVNAMDTTVQGNSSALNTLSTSFTQNAIGELVDQNAPINLQIAQAKTAYCKYLVVIQHLTTKKMMMKAADAQAKADMLLAKAEQTKDKEAKKEARKAQEKANDAKENAAKHAARQAKSEAKILKGQREPKPRKAVRKANVKAKAKSSRPQSDVPTIDAADVPTIDELAADVPTMDELAAAAE